MPGMTPQARANGSPLRNVSLTAGAQSQHVAESDDKAEIPMDAWRARLEAGDTEGAWTSFLAQYHRLLEHTISRCIVDAEDARDAFAHACDRLSDNNLARLRRFHESTEHRAKFSTWLVVVTRHLAIDWKRAREGRARATPPPGLSPLRSRIFQLVLVERLSHAEAFESLCASGGCEMTYRAFVREIAATIRSVDSRRWSYLASLHGASRMLLAQESEPSDDCTREDQHAIVERAVSRLTEQERTALRLFVVEGRPAAEVARSVGWPNAKAVYNRMSRTLTAMRTLLNAGSVPVRPRNE